ncbi:low choriolytic enzyme-like [Nothobranchius furzeri]|uniref:Metalloendopeptidase n=1 Tax=Nothobranchius furzeri TaxID=105023 RepID=A0A8C6LR74_NOTFU|nr:low choriolytic enzyme-like [Nothobranchius furzeri]
MERNTKVSLLLLLLAGICKAHNGNDHDGENEHPVSDSNTQEDISTTILRMNNASMDNLFEGDILIPKTRNALKCFSKQYSCFWKKFPNGYVEVPFTLSDRYAEDEKNAIRIAMRGIEARTCIRFVDHKRERAFLSIQPKPGCFSLVGRVGEQQLVSLQRFGCIANGIIQHELLHSLGFYHEHTRSDRDNYVRINWNNIMESAGVNFRKMNTDNLNTPYDYSSVMHYGRTAFGIRRAETITPIPNPNVPIGQRVGMSEMDFFRVNTLYKCSRYLG